MVEYGKVTPKIVTNSPKAWSLAGIAKRLSFAIDNMNLPIACLMVNTPGGGNVSVYRHGNMETWNLRSISERKYFQLKILRDDGTWIGEDEIASIEIHLDDVLLPIPEHPGEINPPILYVYNYSIGKDPDEEDPNVIKMRDTLYNLKKDGTRDKKRYDPNNHLWTFDGYQRPWSWIWGPTETDDLTKPTSPPYMEGNVHHPAKKWNSNSPEENKYERKLTKGYYIVVRCKDKSVTTYYRIPAESDPEGQLARGYKLKPSSERHKTFEDASLVLPAYYLMRVPYISYITKAEATSLEPGYIHYPRDSEVDWMLSFFSWADINGRYWHSTKTSWCRTYQIKSSVPYTLYELIHPVIDSMIALYAGPPPFGDTNHTVIGTIVSHSGGYRTPPAQIDGQRNYPRTFNPVTISKEMTIIPDEGMNEQSYDITISWSGGFRRVTGGCDFVYYIGIYAKLLPENEI